MKKISVFFLVLLSCNISFAQVDTMTLKENVLKSMDSVNQCFNSRNWGKFTDFMHPKVIEMVGSKDQFITFIDEQMKSMDMMEVKKHEVGEVLQIVKEGKEWQALVTSMMEMQMDTLTVSSISSNVAFSFDEGQTWKFVRVSNGTEESIRMRFPTISKQLRIPYNQTKFTTLDELKKDLVLQYPPDQKLLPKTPARKKVYKKTATKKVIKKKG